MDLTEIKWEGLVWIHLAQGPMALVNTIMNLQYHKRQGISSLVE
jgi:hypothetical protein